jgi:hypothetical protein
MQKFKGERTELAPLCIIYAYNLPLSYIFSSVKYYTDKYLYYRCVNLFSTKKKRCANLLITMGILVISYIFGVGHGPSWPPLSPPLKTAINFEDKDK